MAGTASQGRRGRLVGCRPHRRQAAEARPAVAGHLSRTAASSTNWDDGSSCNISVVSSRDILQGFNGYHQTEARWAALPWPHRGYASCSDGRPVRRHGPPSHSGGSGAKRWQESESLIQKLSVCAERLRHALPIVDRALAELPRNLPATDHSLKALNWRTGQMETVCLGSQHSGFPANRPRKDAGYSPFPILPAAVGSLFHNWFPCRCATASDLRTAVARPGSHAAGRLPATYGRPAGDLEVPWPISTTMSRIISNA